MNIRVRPLYWFLAIASNYPCMTVASYAGEWIIIMRGGLEPPSDMIKGT